MASASSRFPAPYNPPLAPRDRRAPARPIARTYLLLFLLLLPTFLPAQTSPVARTYFLRNDYSLLSITFKDDNPTAVQRLYGRIENANGSGQILFRHLASTVHPMENGLVLDFAFHMDGWENMFMQFGTSETPGPEDPNKPNYRNLFYLAPNSHGAWDCLAAEYYFPDPDTDQEKWARDLLKTWAEKPPTTMIRPDALLPVPAESLATVFTDAKTDIAAATLNLQPLLQAHPADPLLAAINIDLALTQGDDALAASLIEQSLPLLEKQPGVFYPGVLPLYREWLDDLRADREGHNAWSRIARAFSGTNAYSADAYGGYNADDVTAAFRAVKPDDRCFHPPGPSLFFPSEQAPNFLQIQTFAKLRRTQAEFLLFEGRPDDALEILVPIQQFFTIMTGRSNLLIGSLIGIAGSAITTRGMEHVYLNGFDDPAQLQNAWPGLDRLYKLHLDATRHIRALRVEGQLARNALSVPIDNQIEASTRANVAHARIALLHTATAIRYQLMKDRHLPWGGWDKLELLPTGLDRDPFADYRKKLNVRPWRPGEDIVIYSIGPDGKDENAAIDYDPTNGTISAGDLFITVSDPPRYPFPRPGELGRTRDEIIAQFPNGLPPDTFADTRGAGYVITDTSPPTIFSWGPDVDQARPKLTSQPGAKQPREVPRDTPLPPGDAVTTLPNGHLYIYPALTPEADYDPTNGTISDGDIILRPRP